MKEVEERVQYTQGDIQFLTPAHGSVGLNPMTVKEYLPKSGVLTVLSDKGATPHTIQGRNFRIQVGKKERGRHLVAMLFAAESFTVKQAGAEDMTVDSGIYYVTALKTPTIPPLVQ